MCVVAEADQKLDARGAGGYDVEVENERYGAMGEVR